MGRNTTPKKAATKPAAEPKVQSTGEVVEPLFAINRITYGLKQVAPARSIFRPVSAAERQELLNLGAARDCTDDEALLAPDAVAGDPAAPDAPVDEQPALLGSNVQPSIITVGDYDFQLGGLVAAAFDRFNAEVPTDDGGYAGWNGLSDEDREARLKAVIDELMADPATVPTVIAATSITADRTSANPLG